jgi:hypothetical protein
MKRIAVLLATAMPLVFAGCASTDQSTITTKEQQGVKLSAEKSFVLGSRIPRQTSDRMVRSTEKDKADEPVRSLGNDIAKPGT